MKKCPKCKYVRKKEDQASEDECPSCGVIYAKAETQTKNKTTNEPQQADGDFPNYEKYKKCTITKDWKGICDINKVSFDHFGTKKELKVLAEYLEKDEVVFAITSGIMKQTRTSNASDAGLNTWLVALTSERFLFLDHALLTKSVDTQSIRHDRVQAVSASQGLMLGKIQVDLGARVIVLDNCQKDTVKVIANLANKWIRLQEKSNNGMVRSMPNDVLLAQTQKLTNLSIIQIKNQEKIISLLEQIRDRNVS